MDKVKRDNSVGKTSSFARLQRAPSRQSEELEVIVVRAEAITVGRDQCESPPPATIPTRTRLHAPTVVHLPPVRKPVACERRSLRPTILLDLLAESARGD